MRIPSKPADDDHPLVRETALRLIQNRETPRDKLRALFYFVRDDIRFGYPKNGDIVKAPETIHLGFGQGNNMAALRERGWRTGFSISCESDESDPEFNIDEERFVQMDAVTGDHGIYDEPADYYRSPKYLNRPGALTILMYLLVVSLANRKVKRMRKECRTGLCVSSVQAVTTGERI
jgi:hypothetical protein